MGAYRFLVHDRDGIFAPAVDDALDAMSLRVLKTPVRTPQANAHCERFIGTARRECLDWMIPLNERHLRRVLAEWIPHYNGERPHSALGPGLPDEPTPPGDADRPQPVTRASRRCQCSARRPTPPLPPGTRRRVSFCGVQGKIWATTPFRSLFRQSRLPIPHDVEWRGRTHRHGEEKPPPPRVSAVAGAQRYNPPAYRLHR